MERIYDESGRVVGWLRNKVIYDREGQPRAFIRRKAIFNYQGGYLGRLDKGFVRDKYGDAVAFMRGSKGGPLLPIPEVPPVPPVLAIPPVPLVPPLPPIPPVPSLSWSNLR